MAFDDDLRLVGFKLHQEKRDGARTFTLSRNRYLTYWLHVPPYAAEPALFTWEFAIGEYMDEYGLQVGSNEPLNQYLFPQTDTEVGHGGAEPAGQHVVLDRHHQPVRAGHRGQPRVERLDPARVDQGDADALLLEQPRRLLAGPVQAAEPQQQHVRAARAHLPVADLELAQRLGEVDLRRGAVRPADRERPGGVRHGRGQHAAQLGAVARRRHHHAGDLAQVGQVEDAVVRRAVGAGDAGAVEPEHHRQPVQRDVHDHLVEGPLQEGRVDRADRPQPAHGHAGGHGDADLLGDADVVDAVGELARHDGQVGGTEHGRGDGHQLRVAARLLQQRLPEDLGELDLVAGLGQRLAGGGVERLDGVVLVLLVLLRGGVAAALLGEHVQQDRTVHAFDVVQGGQQRAEVVAVHRPGVLPAQVLEHHPGRHHRLGALLDPLGRLQHAVADQRHPAEGVLDALLEGLVARVQAQRRQVRLQAADRGLVGAPVVVEDHQQVRLAAAGQVERLQGDAAGERAVADHRDHASLGGAEAARLGVAEGVAERRGGVGVLDDVVRALAAGGVARQPAERPQVLELGLPPGEQLVDVGLMTGVPDDPVGRGVEHAVQGDGELDDTEVRPQVPAGRGDRPDEELPDLAGQLDELVLAEFAQIAGLSDGFEHSQSSWAPFAIGVVWWPFNDTILAPTWHLGKHPPTSRATSPHGTLRLP